MKPAINNTTEDVGYVVFKKHYCPDCNQKLKTVKVSKTLDYNSPEAKDYDFTFGEFNQFTAKRMKFVWKEFECPKCQRHFTVKELKRIEGIAVDEPNPETVKRRSRRNKIIFYVVTFLAFLLIYLAKKFL